eukprot:TRINITY_DN427_c0_g2_i1.p1 TRINITY_DN427_c0_g2~~TRINITY_DN427_c0_g2_i1.p1  ORF type:complete len:371 (+),score=49.75 TRINITY_DN427_c0_g2_i1:33-1115(+)
MKLLGVVLAVALLGVTCGVTHAIAGRDVPTSDGSHFAHATTWGAPNEHDVAAADEAADEYVPVLDCPLSSAAYNQESDEASQELALSVGQLGQSSRETKRRGKSAPSTSQPPAGRTPNPEAQARITVLYNRWRRRFPRTNLVFTNVQRITGRRRSDTRCDDELDWARLENRVRQVVEEFLIYPASVMRAGRVRAVLVCKNLQVNGQTGWQSRTASPSYSMRVMAYDSGQHEMNYMKHVIHHEFYHMLDYRADGKIYDAVEAWNQFNPAGFSYRNGGATAGADGTTFGQSSSDPSFVSRYATYGIEEDRAETYMKMVVDYNGMVLRAASAPAIRGKMNFIEREMLALDPDLDADWWRTHTI